MNTHGIDLAIFDPSHLKTGSYWQWSNVAINQVWDTTAEIVNGAWPLKMGSFEDQSSILYGVLDESAESRWLYRVFAGGRDSFGRPGRYFFVLFRLRAPEQVISPEVAGVLRYYETERSLPLKTSFLDQAVPKDEPDDLLRNVCEHWKRGDHGIHWGMNGKGVISEFLFTAPKPTLTSPKLTSLPVTARPKEIIVKKMYLLGGLFVSLAVGLFLGYTNSSRNIQELESKNMKLVLNLQEYKTIIQDNGVQNRQVEIGCGMASGLVDTAPEESAK